MRRALEFGVILFAAPMALALFLMTWLIVLNSLGKPVFFSQTRAGLGCTPFQIWKFRTMTDERDSMGELLPDENRVTPGSRILRRLRLDELPQLLSVIRGQMALIGPRPLKPETIKNMGPRGLLRCSVRPGLTGWSQVSGNTMLSDAEKLDLDLWYIEHRTFALDLRILVETVLILVRGERRHAARLDEAIAWAKLSENNA